MNPADLDSHTRRRLAAYGFDDATFERLRARLRHDGATSSNAVTSPLQPPRQGDIGALPPLGSDARRALAARGRQALAAGKVGLVVLAGGMATRFGGVVKAAAEVYDGRTFLDLKLADVQAVAAQTGARIPVFLMSSVATEREVRALAQRLSSPAVPVQVFTQSVMIRLTPDGSLFREPDGTPSLYPPGHGDLPAALRRSGLLEPFREAGGELLFVSNVDNLTATLDPALVGLHVDGGQAITAEVVDKNPGDKGGAPAWMEGTLQTIEGFRFPAGFDQDQIPVFSTNSLWINALELEQDFPLDWFGVTKTIEGRTVVQFERLVGQLTAFLPTRFVRVERVGPDARFQPVKEPEDLVRQVPEIRTILAARAIV